MKDLAVLSASELAPLIAARQVSPVEVVEALLDRIDRLDGHLRAYLTLCGDAALAEARRLERLPPRGPLFGVPIAHKDIYWTQGVRTTAHSRVFEHFVPGEDAESVARLRQAGTILLGKLNTHEMACGSMEWWGAARNPWHTGCIPGGSSSGSGVALAAHLTILATGSDTGGSIRIPAALCGVAGLKPTYGRISLHGIVPLSPSLDHPGPLAKCIADLALVLQAMSGADVSGSLHKGMRGITLGIPRQHFFDRLHPDVFSCVMNAVYALQGEGARLTEVHLPGSAYGPMASWMIAYSEAYAYHKRWLMETPHLYGDFARRRITSGAFFTADELQRAQAVRRQVQAEFAAALQACDAVVAPTTPYPAYPAQAHAALQQDVSRLTRPVSLTGLPAASVPCGFSGAGLPIGLQIVGREWDEATVLQIAAAYEAITDWHRRRPDPLAERPLPAGTAQHEALPAADPDWVRSFAQQHGIPLQAADAEPIARLLGPVRARLAELA